VFIDTPGVHHARDAFNRVLVQTAVTALEEVDLICFVIEAPRAGDEINAFILDILDRTQTPVLLVINKIDLVAKPALLPVMEDYSHRRSFEAIVPVSALLNDRVEVLLGEIVRRLPEGPRYITPKTSSPTSPSVFSRQDLCGKRYFTSTRAGCHRGFRRRPARIRRALVCHRTSAPETAPASRYGSGLPACPPGPLHAKKPPSRTTCPNIPQPCRKIETKTCWKRA